MNHWISLSLCLSLSLCTQASAGVSAMENTHLWITSPGLFSPIWPTVCQGVRLGGWSLNTSSLWEGRVPEGEVTAAAAAAVVVFVYSFFAFTFTFTSSGGAPHPDAPSGGSERGLSCDTFARLTGHGDRKTDRRADGWGDRQIDDTLWGVLTVWQDATWVVSLTQCSKGKRV